MAYILLETPQVFQSLRGREKRRKTHIIEAQASGFLFKNSLCMAKTYDPYINPTWALYRLPGDAWLSHFRLRSPGNIQAVLRPSACGHGSNLISHTDKDRKCKVRRYEGAASNFTSYIWESIMINGQRLLCDRRFYLVLFDELKRTELLKFSCAMPFAIYLHFFRSI